jgi:uncharacterized protein
MTEHVPPVESHLIPSRYVAQTFRVQVMQPLQRRGETTRFPVVYATDGNLTFDMLKGISHILQASERDAQRFILVGIGYPGDSPRAGTLLRGRDMTFPGYPRLDRTPPAIEGVLLPQAGTPDFCGAQKFQEFIEHELIPLIDQKYAALTGERTYFGHSVGGGFGLYTLFTRPMLFRNYIVSSPGLTYHGESSGGVRYEQYEFGLDLAREFLARKPALAGRRLYLSVGSEEEFEPALASWQLTSSMQRMSVLLEAASVPGLKLLSEILPGETHSTAWPISFSHGVQAVFGTGVRHQRLNGIEMHRSSNA